MFKSTFSLSSLRDACKVLLSGPPALLTTHTRNTFILRRKYPLPLRKANFSSPRMKYKYYIYEMVEFTSVTPRPSVSVILTKYVPGIGDVGDKITTGSRKAYYRFILPHLAVYDTPENAAKYSQKRQDTERIVYSSKFVQSTLEMLSKTIIYIHMNSKSPWVLEPWHVSVGFQNTGFTVPKSAITLPPDEIRGPDLNLENKEFFITVTINNKEKVYVRCRIYHWSEGYEFNDEKEYDALFPEQAELLKETVLPIQL